MTKTLFQLPGSSDAPIRGEIHLPDNVRGAPVVVCCHGFKGFKDWGFWPETARRLAGAGMAAVTFNFSGSGIGEDPERFTETELFETNTVAKELVDLGTVLDAVTRRGLPLGAADVRCLGVLGHSRGGGIAVLRAGRDPRVKALVTWAAVSTFHRFTDEQREIWRRQGSYPIENARTGQVFHLRTDFLEDVETHAEAYDVAAAVSRLRIPYLLIHGTRDETVPVEEAHRLAEEGDKALTRTLFLQDGTHTFGAAHPFTGSTPSLDRALDETISWFQNALKPSG